MSVDRRKRNAYAWQHEAQLRSQLHSEVQLWNEGETNIPQDRRCRPWSVTWAARDIVCTSRFVPALLTSHSSQLTELRYSGLHAYLRLPPLVILLVPKLHCKCACGRNLASAAGARRIAVTKPGTLLDQAADHTSSARFWRATSRATAFRSATAERGKKVHSFPPLPSQICNPSPPFHKQHPLPLNTVFPKSPSSPPPTYQKCNVAHALLCYPARFQKLFTL